MTPDIRVLGCRLIGSALRLAYGFRVEGAENMPDEGPYIALNVESSFLCIACDAAASASLLLKPFREGKLMTFAGEELFAIPFVRKFAKTIHGYALLPHAAGQYGLNLLRAMEHLKQGGVIVMNPEGDMSRDGRPLPIRDGAAWLGLHTGVPIVPIVVSAGVYDIWPPWKMRPSLGGHIVQSAGKPFRLTDHPLPTIRQEDLDAANARIRAEINALCYGSGGVTAWAGQNFRRPAAGQPATPEPRTQPAAPTPINGRENGWPFIPVRKRGPALLLWRCPICGADDAPVYRHPVLRPRRVECRSCGVVWRMQRAPGNDFRLQVVRSPDYLRGLEMPLSGWYDRIKDNFALCPISAPDFAAMAGEEVYLQANAVTMLVNRPSSLLSGEWRDSEPPATEAPKQPGEWARLGPGTLWLTNRRFVWQGPPGPLDFWWSRVTAISLRLYYLLGVHYRSTPYRFWLARDNGLKWLTYAGTVASRVEAGRKITVTPF